MKKKSSAQKLTHKKKFPLTGTSIILFVFSFLLYSNTLTHDFTLDDELVLGRNELVLSGLKSLPDLFTKSYRYGFNHENTGQYRPLSPIFFAAEIQFFGFNAHTLHFFNILYYSLCVTLIFIALYNLLLLVFPVENPAPFRISVIASLLFATHPLHTEVVANIKSRDEIFALLFMMGSLFFMIRFIKNKRTSLVRPEMFYSLLCYYLALLSKESAITYLGIVPLISLFFGKQSLKKTLFITFPFLLLSILYIISVFSFLDQTLGTKAISVVNNSLVQKMTFIESFSTKIYILGKYLFILTLPFPLLFDYSYNHIPVMHLADLNVIVSFLFNLALLIVGVTILIKSIVVKHSSPLPSFLHLTSFSILFYFITISIVTNIFIIIEATAAERFLFTPSLGYCLLIATLIHYFTYPRFSVVPQKNQHWIFFMILIPYLLFFTLKTWNRNPDWKNDFTLFKADIDYLPNSARANYCMGTAYFRNADNPSLNQVAKNDFLHKAVSHLDRVLEIFPDYKEAWINGGLVYSRLGNSVNAIKYLEKAVLLDTISPKTSYALAVVCLSAKEMDKALQALQMTIRRDSLYVEALNDLGAVYGSKGRFPDALKYFKSAFQINPAFQGVKNNLIHTYLQLGDTVNARRIEGR